jgi:superfamily II DNA or RNA helicase
MTATGSKIRSKTLYGLTYAGLVIDEAHGARNVGRQYSAFYQARTQSAFTVALTATPVTTRPLVSQISF